MEILKNNSDNRILINTESNFITNITWEDNIKQYEENLLESIINPTINYETNRFKHEPYISENNIVQDDLWMYFYFYNDGNGTGHTGGLNYENIGLSLENNTKLTVNVSESFFRLDFYKIPLLNEDNLDFVNKKLVFTKNLRIPLGEKVFYNPIKDYIYVPIFHGSTYTNEENMTFYWFTDDSALSDITLTGDTFYMSARFFNSIDGSIFNFTKNSLTINNEINENTDVYYKVTINKNNKTYQVTGSGRYGLSNNPIKFYSNTVYNNFIQKYKEPLIIDYTINNPITIDNNDGSITFIIYNGIPKYTYSLFLNDELINENITSDMTHTFQNLEGGITYNITIKDNINSFYNKTIELLKSYSTYNYEIVKEYTFNGDIRDYSNLLLGSIYDIKYSITTPDSFIYELHDEIKYLTASIDITYDSINNITKLTQLNTYSDNFLNINVYKLLMNNTYFSHNTYFDSLTYTTSLIEYDINNVMICGDTETIILNDNEISKNLMIDNSEPKINILNVYTEEPVFGILNGQYGLNGLFLQLEYSLEIIDGKNTLTSTSRFKNEKFKTNIWLTDDTGIVYNGDEIEFNFLEYDYILYEYTSNKVTLKWFKEFTYVGTLITNNAEASILRYGGTYPDGNILTISFDGTFNENKVVEIDYNNNIIELNGYTTEINNTNSTFSNYNIEPINIELINYKTNFSYTKID